MLNLNNVFSDFFYRLSKGPMVLSQPRKKGVLHISAPGAYSCDTTYDKNPSMAEPSTIVYVIG